MNIRGRLWLLAGCYLLTCLVAAWALPIEPTAQELSAIVEQEYGRTLDGARQCHRDLPGPIQAMMEKQNWKDLAATERGIFREERWILRSIWTFLGGTALAGAILSVVNRRQRQVATRPDQVVAAG